MLTISPLLLARQTIFRLPIVCTSRTFSAMPPNKLPESSPNFASEDGRYHRQTSDFLHHVAKGTKFEPEVGRYKLIVSLACPWAHRALIVRHLKRMHEVENLLPLTIVDTFLGREGWSVAHLNVDRPNVHGTGNNIPGHESKRFLREFYLEADPSYAKRPTVPVLWDNKLNTIVNNESSELIRCLNTAFDDFLPEEVRGVTYYPEDLRKDIDAFHEWVLPNINNGVYRSGFASSMDAYQEAVIPLFESLERVDKEIGNKKFVMGDRLTEADIRLFTTIVRFDPVYHGHFKCNIQQIRGGGLPNLHRWLREMYWTIPAFKETTCFESIKVHYYSSHVNINPTSIVPVGPIPPIMPLDA